MSHMRRSAAGGEKDRQRLSVEDTGSRCLYVYGEQCRDHPSKITERRQKTDRNFMICIKMNGKICL